MSFPYCNTIINSTINLENPNITYKEFDNYAIIYIDSEYIVEFKQHDMYQLIRNHLWIRLILLFKLNSDIFEINDDRYAILLNQSIIQRLLRNTKIITNDNVIQKCEGIINFLLTDQI